MKLPGGSGLSVRGLTSLGLAALALLCLVVAIGVAWVAAQLQSTSSSLVRDSESLRLASRIELQILNYQRLAALVDDPEAQQQRRSVQLDLENSLRSILLLPVGPAEGVLIGRSAQDVDSYLTQRAELEQSGIRVPEIQRRSRPALSRALESLRLLTETDEKEVAAAYAEAQRVGSFFIAAAIATVVLAACLLLVTTVAARRLLLRPILALRGTIDRFRSGDLLAKADEHAPREIAEIARAFNEMSDELGRQKTRELAFIGSVAHDLRNPLAALRFSLDAMQARRTNWDRETEQLVGVLGRQLDHLSRMVNDLLETCYIESGELTLRREAFDLRDAARAVVDLYRPVASDRVIDLEVCEDSVRVRADRTRIEQVVGNLLSNSIKYSNGGTRIGVRVAQHGDTAELRIADQGIGISAADCKNIFRPFWRADTSGKRSGTGLGLSVVRKIVVAHEGTIGVDSSPGSGSVFYVRIPRLVTEPKGTSERTAAPAEHRHEKWNA